MVEGWNLRMKKLDNTKILVKEKGLNLFLGDEEQSHQDKTDLQKKRNNDSLNQYLLLLSNICIVVVVILINMGDVMIFLKKAI